MRLNVLLVVKAFLDDHVQHGVQHRDIAPGLELQHVGRVALQRLAARVHHDERRAALHGVLEEGGGDRMVLGRVGTDHHDDIGILRRHEGRGDRARANALEQPRNRRSVAKPRAMVDVVGSESRAHQLLEEVSLLVRTLRRAEACQALAAVLIADALQARGRAIEGFFPCRLAKMRPGIGGVDLVMRVLLDPWLADHRHCEPPRMAHVIEAEAAFDAEPVLVRGSVAAVDVKELVVLDLVGDLTADAAVGADTRDLAVDAV